MRSSAVLIVRNEAAVLGRCLDSLAGAVDEIVVLDTGSTDETRAIAEACGAVVGGCTWQDDFAAARNAALDLATGDIALVIDADEWLESPEEVRAQLATFGIAATPDTLGLVYIHNEPPPGGDLQATTDETPRVFLRAAFRYAGRIHEQPESVSGRPPRAVLTGIRLRHSGYAQRADDPAHKAHRNIALLRAAMADAPEDAYLHYQLGKAWFSLQRYRAAAIAFDQALRRIDFDSRPPQGSHGPVSREMLTGAVCTRAYALIQSEQRDAALSLLEEHARLAHAGTERADFHHALGYVRLQLGQWDAAEAAYRASLGRPEDVRGTGSFATWYHLGLIAMARGDHATADACNAEALALEPGYLPALRKLLEDWLAQDAADIALLRPYAASGAFHEACLEKLDAALQNGAIDQAERLTKAAIALDAALLERCRTHLETYRR